MRGSFGKNTAQARRQNSAEGGARGALKPGGNETDVGMIEEGVDAG